MSKTIQTINKCRSRECGLEFSLIVLHRPANHYLVATSCPMCRADVEILQSMMLEIESPDREKHEVTGSVQRRPLDVAHVQERRASLTNDALEAITDAAGRLPMERLENFRNEIERLMRETS